MFLTNPFPFPKSLRHHLIIGLSVSLIVVFIIVFLHPFGAGDIDFPYKNIYFTGYGFIVFSTYILLHFISKVYYSRFSTWQWLEEVVFCLTFILLLVIFAFFFTELVINRNPSRVNFAHFTSWFGAVFFGFGTIIFALTLTFRKYWKEDEPNRHPAPKNQDNIQKTRITTIYGTLKNESITLHENSILYIESQDNYIIAYFMNEDQVQSKMLRKTLKNTHLQLPFLLKTHRSFLVNTNYVIRLTGNSQNAKLQLKNSDTHIPVSKTYYESIKKATHSPLN